MKAIYASKLYKASRRKYKIQAALQNPVNVELVKQLTEYLDEEYQPTEPVESEEPSNEESSDQKIRPSEHSSGGGGGGFSGGGTTGFDDGGADLGELTEDFEAEREEALSPDSTDVEESTHVSGQSIQASSAVDNIVDASDEIKGLLNSRADSTGVVRVAVVDNILHVYFDEDINLNEVMEPAISVLNAAGYSGLNFKKLSRSDNAMTFDIDEVPNPVQPVADSTD